MYLSSVENTTDWEIKRTAEIRKTTGIKPGEHMYILINFRRLAILISKMAEKYKRLLEWLTFIDVIGWLPIKNSYKGLKIVCLLQLFKCHVLLEHIYLKSNNDYGLYYNNEY